MVLGEARPGEEAAVSALAFNAAGSMLLAAHANGDVVLWEWHRTAWEAVKFIRGQLGSKIPSQFPETAVECAASMFWTIGAMKEKVGPALNSTAPPTGRIV